MAEEIKIDETTRKVQLKCLDALIEVRRICEKYNIKYYLVGGTALGAIRHKGFIPWDDDVDVGMPRKDYNKFVEICKEELAPMYTLQTSENMNKIVFPYTKIRVNDTLYKEEVLQHINMHHGIFIDIFPLDNIPNNNILRGIQKYGMKFTNVIRFSKILIAEKNNKNFYIKLFISKLYPDLFVRWQYHFFMNLANKKETVMIGNLVGAYSYEKEAFKKSVFGEGEKVVFEKEYFTVPKQTKEFLKGIYGPDYNQLPPVEKRLKHKPAIIEGL